MRIAQQPSERIDRSQEISFRFDGKSVVAHPGDTIASALLASGQRVFSRSFKYHRPRGETCGAGRCAGSLVDVDGWPGIRACSEAAREGAEVRHLNAWPSLRFDLMRSVDLFGGPLTPPGFYYKTFIRPRRLQPLYQRLLRKAAGLGRLDREQAERRWRTDYRRRHCDVLVIGAGIAGLRAALAAAESGADTVLVDDDIEPGGRLLAEGEHQLARELAESVRDHGVELLTSASALGYFDGLVPVWQGDTLHQIRAQAHVAAAGTVEQPLVFTNNDLPGVLSTRGARRLSALFGVAPGRKVLAAVTGEAGLADVLAAAAAGVEFTAIADLRPIVETQAQAAAAELGIPVLAESTVLQALGRNGVRGAVTGRVDSQGRARPGTAQKHRCDAILVDGGELPASSLLLQAGAKASFDPVRNQFIAEPSAEPVLAAGAVAGHASHDAAAASGTVAGIDAALAAGCDGGGATPTRQEAAEQLRAASEVELAAAVPPPAAQHGRGKAFIDLDEDVTTKDIAYAAAEGYDSIELAKRYTTATMGPSQGRFSQLAAVRALGLATGQEPGQVGLTTARPPWSSVPLGALAGRPFEPAKRSAVHARHRELGANVQWAGDWRRAYDYGDPEAEALAVHRAAGLIDVSTLGKLILSGPDAGEFLDRLYPNRHSNLRPGRIRYAVLTSEAGRISDDGTVYRIDEQSFYVTTTSSGAGAVEQWFSWWQAEWQLDVKLFDVTQGLCAVNLAGPRSREILSRLGSFDCSAEGFEYLDGREIRVAGVNCLALRIGFVGELGYELHFPAAYGQHVWDAILEAGSEHGIRPFGLEPQRILRLQKQHILIGQDTDSESQPAAAAMPWIVKLDKPDDFVGRWALSRVSELEPQSVLVGFTVEGGHVPTEGSVVVLDGKAAGQVTSSRYAPGLDQVIGLAWVPPELAQEAAALEISDGGEIFAGQVRTKPFYDPDGEVQRS